MCPILSMAWRAGMDYLKLMSSYPSSASATDDMTALMILDIVNNAPLFGDTYVFVDIKKCPPALLLAFVLERYEVSLWTARTISLARYVIMASGWVTTYSNNCFNFCIVCSVGFAFCDAME